jgi:SAM-dependent methyltransferase
MTSATEHGERLQREAAFHDQWASGIDPAHTLVDETFTSATAIENQYILEQFGSLKGKRVLDYGCGAAEGGVYFAKQGATVVGVDVSPGMLAVAKRLAEYHGVAIETRQVQGERIPADNGEFDLIYGNGVLHHVDLSRSRPELARIMKPEGRGCFIEPLTYNPVIEVYRRIADTVRTPDEHPLSFRDIESFRDAFGEVTHREFWLTTLAVFLRFYLWERVDPRKERYWKKIYTDAERLSPFYTPLQRIDTAILSRLPFLGRLCWNTVITVGKPLAAKAS